MASQSRRTVLVALGANLVIAATKTTGGVLSGSSALIAEAAHSVADTANQALLLVALRLGRRPRDEEHPFGYGREQFFWSFVVAVSIFVAGGIFSIGEGVFSLAGGEQGEHRFLVAATVLGIALAAEGTALTRATIQLRRDAREARTGFREHLRRSKDPTVKVAFSEDTAAVVGVVIALTGLVLARVTGDGRWDGLAAVAIGVLLMVVAFLLALDIRGLLIGEAATPEDREALRHAICSRPEVDDLVDLLTTHIGPDRILVAAKVAFADVDADRIEAAADAVERDMRAAVPAVSHVFLDPTGRPGGSPDGPPDGSPGG